MKVMYRKKKSSQNQETLTRTYSWFSNILYNMKASWIWDKKLFWYQLLPVLPNVTATYLAVLLPAELVRGLENRWELGDLLLKVFLLAAALCVLRLADEGMKQYIYRNAQQLTMYYEKCCYHKVMRLNYDLLEEPACARLIANTWNVLRHEHGTRTSISAVPQILSSLIGIFWYGILIGQKNWIILAVVMANTLLSIRLLAGVRKRHALLHEQISSCSRQTAYISRQSMDKISGKDIRLYRMTDWFLKKYDHALGEMDSIYKQIHDRYFYRAVTDGFMTLLLNLFSYSYLLYLLSGGELEISQFVLYTGLIGSFASCFGTFMNQLASMNQICVSLNYIRSFLELEEDPGWSEGVGEAVMEQLKKQGLTVEFDHVSYCYPEKRESGRPAEPTLRDVSLTISAGEKLALIGLNGAGKTTLVKLLCGFYRPTSGEIRLNGIPAAQFSKAEYMELVSVLFQDSTLLPMSLDRNLTGEPAEKIDRSRLKWALRMSGFLEKYESLPQKGETLLVREANGDALDFSGGEHQKLLFARALYKEAPLMILDEPTAALDPIAENEMYQKFGESAAGRTCVYISHRLSSTRFCDRILLMEEGQITEEGTHEELMERGGRYAQLFEVQSMYYRNREVNADEQG